MFKNTFPLAIFLWFSCTLGNSAALDHGKVVVCYIDSESFERKDLGNYDLYYFEGDLCTHVIYAYAGLSHSGLTMEALNPALELSTDARLGIFEELNEFKQKHKNLKTLIALGGPRVNSATFSQLVGNETLRQGFNKLVTIFLRTYGFDGLDLSWDYPTRNGGRPEDAKNFLTWIKELRSAFDQSGFILTATIGTERKLIEDAYHITELCKYLDHIHLKTFDYYDNNSDNLINYNAPLRMTVKSRWCVLHSINFLFRLGATPAKLVLGIPFYGRIYKVTPGGLILRMPNDLETLKETDKALSKDELDRYNSGKVAYNEICLNVDNGWNYTWLKYAGEVVGHMPYDSSAKYRTKIIYENTRAAALRARYAVGLGLAGVFAWSIDLDDFRSICVPEYETYYDFKTIVPQSKIKAKAYPLLRAINFGLKLAKIEIEADPKSRPGN